MGHYKYFTTYTYWLGRSLKKHAIMPISTITKIQGGKKNLFRIKRWWGYLIFGSGSPARLPGPGVRPITCEFLVNSFCSCYDPYSNDLMFHIYLCDRTSVLGVICHWAQEVLTRDLARTRLACLLDRQFPENLLFGQANFAMLNFQF